MHGRIKVRTTEEEKERKRKENLLKIKAYKSTMAKIHAKRNIEELDDEMLLLTSQILQRNPDVLTLWNIRRECIQKRANEINSEGKEQVSYEAELSLTEQCLIVNHKSYGAWHHRCWTLEQNWSPNWEREVQLCNKYLKMDDRNFLTWNYRRYVVKKANVEKQKELDFCTEKIKANFSNYSSWHYRSILLPKLYPSEGAENTRRPMNELKLKEEMEMVLTAAFTDPNDSSAWFYQRWLLGYSRPDLKICAFRINKQKAVVAFTTPTTKEAISKLIIYNPVENIRLELDSWLSVNNSYADTIWVVKVPTSQIFVFNPTIKYELRITSPYSEDPECEAMHLVNITDGLYYFKPPHNSVCFSADILGELSNQLESCNNLLEYEPDSKWALLTSALLMRAINSQLYHQQSLDYLEKLQQVDFLRKGYYKDLASKWILEKMFKDWTESEVFPACLSLKGEPKLTFMHYSQYVVIADQVLYPAYLKNIKTFSNIV